MWNGSCSTSLKVISAAALLTLTWIIALTYTDFLVSETEA